LTRVSTHIPRLRLSDLPLELAEALRPRVERLGYLGEFFQCTAHQPEALLSFMSFTEDLKQALPEELLEIVALTVTTVTRNRYERHQHERVCLRLGFTEEWIGAVGALAPQHAPALREEERLVQQLVLAVLARHGRDVRPELEAAIAAIGPAQAVAVLLAIGRFVTHGLIANALELAPPVESIFGRTPE
jgi:alkylhydroperoxidase family enzyme